MVSVIIPIKNREKELIRALNSVFNQTIKTKIEVLVIDDKSEVNLKKVIHQYGDDRIIYVKNDKENSNANVCRNIGIQLAKGEYIAMLDSDDEWLPEHLEKQIHFLENNNCDGVFGNYYINDGISLKEIKSRTFLTNEKMVNYLLSDGKAATPTHVYTAKSCKTILWDENLLRHQDYDFSIRYANVFRFFPSMITTTIVHWGKNEKRNIHHESQIYFLKKHKDEIEPRLFYKYTKSKYLFLKKQKNVKNEVLKFYKNQSSNNIKFISFVDFVEINGKSESSISKIILRIKFILKVLFA